MGWWRPHAAGGHLILEDRWRSILQALFFGEHAVTNSASLLEGASSSSEDGVGSRSQGNGRNQSPHLRAWARWGPSVRVCPTGRGRARNGTGTVAQEVIWTGVQPVRGTQASHPPCRAAFFIDLEGWGNTAFVDQSPERGHRCERHAQIRPASAVDSLRALVLRPHLLAFGSAPSTGMPSFSAERSKTSERPKPVAG